MARVVFLGTPEAAVPTMEALVTHHDVELVVTQPDRPKGRSGEPRPSPVKERALEQGLTVAQPNSSKELMITLEKSGPFDVGVVVAYGRILSPETLDLPTHGFLNVHFSLLPRWRGAAPVARALMAGDEMTGVTIMRLDEGLDTGPILTAQAIDIPEGSNAGELTNRLAGVGARLLADILPRYLAGDEEPIPQTDDGATYADKIEKQDRPIDPQADAASVVAKIRALAPGPTATLVLDGETHKIYEARLTDEAVAPGRWLRIGGRAVAGFPGGAVELMTLQPPGKKPQSGSEWVNGRQTDHGVIDQRS